MQGENLTPSPQEALSPEERFQQLLDQGRALNSRVGKLIVLFNDPDLVPTPEQVADIQQMLAEYEAIQISLDELSFDLFTQQFQSFSTQFPTISARRSNELKAILRRSNSSIASPPTTPNQPATATPASPNSSTASGTPAALDAATITLNRTEQRDTLRRDNVIQQINDTMHTLENSASPVMTKETDLLERDVEPLYKSLTGIRELLSEDEYLNLEMKISFFDYRFTKRLLHALVEAHELSEIDFKDFIGNLKKEVIEQRIYNRILRIISRFQDTPAQNGSPARESRYSKQIQAEKFDVKEMEADFKRARDEAELRMDVYMTEQSLDHIIWWNGKDDETASRGLPGGAGVFFSINQSKIEQVIQRSENITTNSKLRFVGESRLNPELPQRKRTVQKRKFDDPEKLEDVELMPTVHGEVMRLLDALYANKLHLLYKKKYEAEKALGNNISEFPQIKTLDGFFKTMHISDNKFGIPRIVSQAALHLYGVKISEAQVRRAWYMHTLFLNHSMLLNSSPSLSDTAYYANQFLSYASSEAKQKVNRYPYSRVLAFVGKFDADRVNDVDPGLKNPDGKNFIFNILGTVTQREMGGTHGPHEWLAKHITPVSSDDSTYLRQRMLASLHEAHLDHYDPAHHQYDFRFLANLPYRAIHKSKFGTYPILPLPLQFMVFTEADQNAYPKKRGDKEVLVKRWKNPGSSDVRRPIVAADYLTKDGEILYEEIKWEEILDASSIKNWYNNGKNIQNLLNIFKADAKNDMFSIPELATNNKESKYGAVFFPEIGLEALVGRIDVEKLFDRINEVRVFAQALYMIGRKKTLVEVEQDLNELVPTISAETIRAMVIVLKAGFGTREAMEEYGKLFAEEVESALKFDKGH